MAVAIVARQHRRFQSCQRELRIHEFGMLLVDTEAKRPHAVQAAVSNIFLHLLQNEPRSKIVLRVNARQFGYIVTMSAPFYLRQIHIVGYAIIMERRKEAGVEGCRQTDFRRNVPIKENRNIFLFISTLRRGCQTEKDLRLEASHQFDVCRSHNVVHFIHHHILVIVCRELQTIQAITQCVLARENMLKAGRFVVAVPQTAKIGVVKDNAEGLHGLSQNFLTMGNEKKMTVGMRFTIAFEVESRYDGFSRTRSSHHKVAEMSVHVAFHVKFSNISC